MPVKVPDNLPAKHLLEQENIFIINDSRAFHQDIRPLRILILNLMPLKEDTEIDLLRAFSNTPLQVEVIFLHMESYDSKNTSREHLSTFYKVFSEVSGEKFDGMIITGAPIEKLEFEEVIYWDELKKILEWSKTNVTSTFHLCWGAQAGLYYHYGIPRRMLEEKMFGVFKHHGTDENIDLLRGFDDEYSVPHSRYFEVKREDIEGVSELQVISESDESGINILISRDEKQIFVIGHSEYGPFKLKEEYLRDLQKGEKIEVPKNYFKEDDPNQSPIVSWRAHGNLLYNNWLNYYVYQETPFDVDLIGDL